MTRLGIQVARTPSPVICERCGRSGDAPCVSRLTGLPMPRWHVARVIAAVRHVKAGARS